MKELIKTVGKMIVPYAYFYRLRQVYRQKFGRLNHDEREQDIIIYEIQPDVIIKVYWKVLPIGKGPAITFIVTGDEILRFDCFGKGKGHYHIFCGYEYFDRDRFYFSEKTVDEQINRAIFELSNNLKCYLQLHRSPDIRNLEIDSIVVKKICEQALHQMLEYFRTIPEFADMRI